MKETLIEVDDKEVLAMLARLNQRISDMRIVMRDIVGPEIVKGVQENFTAEGRYSVVGDGRH